MAVYSVSPAERFMAETLVAQQVKRLYAGVVAVSVQRRFLQLVLRHGAAVEARLSLLGFGRLWRRLDARRWPLLWSLKLNVGFRSQLTADRHVKHADTCIKHNAMHNAPA